MRRIKEILLESQLDLAALLLGVAMIGWGTLAFFNAPQDYYNFAPSTNAFSIYFWLFNYVTVGLGFILSAIYKFPSMLSLVTGSWACLIWTWIILVRLSSEHTSGIILNFLVVLLGALLIQRSDRK